MTIMRFIFNVLMFSSLTLGLISLGMVVTQVSGNDTESLSRWAVTRLLAAVCFFLLTLIFLLLSCYL